MTEVRTNYELVTSKMSLVTLSQIPEGKFRLRINGGSPACMNVADLEVLYKLIERLIDDTSRTID